MTIKEIIDKERWREGYFAFKPSIDHNASLERIADAVSKRIAKLKKQLEPVTIQEMYELEVIKDLHPKQINEVLVAMAKQIAELKEQLPKVVTPKTIGKDALGFEVYQCGCNSMVLNALCGVENYCPECGSKLNWEEA